MCVRCCFALFRHGSALLRPTRDPSSFHQPSSRCTASYLHRHSAHIKLTPLSPTVPASPAQPAAPNQQCRPPNSRLSIRSVGACIQLQSRCCSCTDLAWCLTPHCREAPRRLVAHSPRHRHPPTSTLTHSHLVPPLSEADRIRQVRYRTHFHPFIPSHSVTPWC